MAGDEEVVRCFDCESLACLCEFKAHENRYLPVFSVCMCGECYTRTGNSLRKQSALITAAQTIRSVYAACCCIPELHDTEVMAVVKTDHWDFSLKPVRLGA